MGFVDCEELVTEFYYRELSGTLEEFDFSRAFKFLRELYLEPKLAEHGLLGVDWYIDRLENIYGPLEMTVPDWMIMETPEVWFGKEDAIRAVAEAQIEVLRERFENDSPFAEMLEAYRKTFSPSLSLREKAHLFDSIVHLEHCYGELLDDVDVEECRREAERMWEEVKDDMDREAVNGR